MSFVKEEMVKKYSCLRTCDSCGVLNHTGDIHCHSCGKGRAIFETLKALNEEGYRKIDEEFFGSDKQADKPSGEADESLWECVLCNEFSLLGKLEDHVCRDK